MAVNTINIKAIKVHPFASSGELIDYVNRHPSILVAINAEKVVNADKELVDIINKNIGYCDGAGAVKALRRKGAIDATRIPGCELWLNIIDRYHDSKSFYFIGGKPGIVDEVINKLKTTYPDLNVAGYRDGYIKDNAERQALIDDIAEQKPDVVFVAMGSPRQEFLMSMMQQKHPAAIYQGLGGSFDVYSGHQKRAPKWWQKHNLEFLYRFIITPSRIKRIWPYIKYALLLYSGRL